MGELQTYAKEQDAGFNAPMDLASMALRPAAADLVSTFFASFAGGYADAMGFLVAGSFTGHITGNLVLLVTSAASGHISRIPKPLVAIVSFLFATVLGIITQRSSMRGLKGAVLFFQCLLIGALGLGAVRLSPWFGWALVVAYALCLGLQNGYTGVADGVAVHPSYMSGTATRLAKALVLLTGHDEDRNDARSGITAIISSTVLAGFIAGALSAVVAQRASASYAPTLLCIPLVLAALASRRQAQKTQSLHPRITTTARQENSNDVQPPPGRHARLDRP